MNTENMQHHKGSKHNAEVRRTKLAKMMLTEPMTQAEYGEHFGVDQSVISRDMKRIAERWAENQAKNVDLAREKVVKRLEWVFKEACRAWEASKKDTVTTRTRSGKAERGNVKDNTTTRTTQSGDARYLQIAKDAAVEIANYRGVRKEDMIADYRVSLLPRLPEEEFKKFGLGAERKLADGDVKYESGVQIRGDEQTGEPKKQSDDE